MSTLNRAVLKQCLLESTMQEIREIEALDYSSITADIDFKNKISSIIHEAEQNNARARSKRITISLIAAILVCFSIIFSVSARIRTAVINFFVEVYDSFAVLFIDDEENTEDLIPIDVVYEPSYLKENGYKQVSQAMGEFKNFTIWTNDNNVTVDFSQHAIYKNDITLDVEDTSYETTYIGERKVHYTVKNDIYFIKWLEYGYSFNLGCDTTLEWSEIEKIISSLQPIS